MSQKSQTALEKMQQIAGKLISNTPELIKVLEPDSALRPKRTTSPSHGKKKHTQPLQFTKSDLTSNDYHEKCKQLHAQLQNSKAKVQTLEEELTVIKQRFVEREIQYRKIIEELQDQMRSKSSLDNNDRVRMNQINQLHKEILDNIGTIQHKTSKILIEQQSDIRRFFHKKITQIKDKFREDKLNKNQKDNQYQIKEKQMASELQWIKNIAQKIDNENQTLMKKYASLKSEFDMQQKDKDLLMRQLLMKKKQNAVLKSQVQQYQQLLNEVSKEVTEDVVRLPTEDSKMRGSNVSGDAMSLNQNSRLRNQPSSLAKPNNNQNSSANLGNSQSLQNTIFHLKNVISKQKKRVRDLKALYMREVGGKSQLEVIIRQLIDDVRMKVVQVERKKIKDVPELTAEIREQLLQKILENQKVMTIVYDKMFYTHNKGITKADKIPNELAELLEDQEGFDKAD